MIRAVAFAICRCRVGRRRTRAAGRRRPRRHGLARRAGASASSRSAPHLAEIAFAAGAGAKSRRRLELSAAIRPKPERLPVVASYGPGRHRARDRPAAATSCSRWQSGNSPLQIDRLERHRHPGRSSPRCARSRTFRASSACVGALTGSVELCRERARATSRRRSGGCASAARASAASSVFVEIWHTSPAHGERRASHQRCAARVRCAQRVRRREGAHAPGVPGAAASTRGPKRSSPTRLRERRAVGVEAGSSRFRPSREHRIYVDRPGSACTRRVRTSSRACAPCASGSSQARELDRCASRVVRQRYNAYGGAERFIERALRRARRREVVP